MRETKFRAWLSKEGKMYEDTFAVTESGQMIVVEQDAVHLNPDYIFLDEGEYTLLQFTGLKDKNGIEIYEGDIVQADGEYGDILTGEIHYKNGCFMLREHTLKQIYNEEVVGNIYDNPDLIK